MADQGAVGRCFCERVEIEARYPLDFVAHCHCESCRRSHAAAFVTWTSVPLDRFTINKGEAEITWYGSSEHIEWGFCRHCGSPMLYRAVSDGHPESPSLDRMYISAACLDRLDRAPQSHVSYEEHSALLEGFNEIPRFRGKTDQEMDS